MFHCGGGLGVSQADYFVSLTAGVETGNVPQRIEASRVVAGETQLTRPARLTLPKNLQPPERPAG